MTAPAVRYPVSRPALGETERAYLLDAFDSGWVSSQGPYVERVTREFPELVGASSGCPCSNGTTALHLALLALGVGPGDEVVVPNLTYVATANAPLFVGATPVLADVRPSDWSVDPAQVERLLTPRTRGVVAVHLYGVLADLSELRALCDARGLWLVEDCAEALGAAPPGREPGRHGEASTWSFYGNKVVTSGEGGFVTTRSRDDLVRRVVSYRGQAVDPERRYFHLHLGFNYRLTNLQCALLAAQIRELPSRLAARRRIQDAYDRMLEPGIRDGLLERTPRPDVCWLYPVVLSGAEGAPGRDETMDGLAKDGIETRPFFVGMDRLPHFAGAPRGPQPVSHRLSRLGLNVPTYVGLEEPDLRAISTALLTRLSARLHAPHG